MRPLDSADSVVEQGDVEPQLSPTILASASDADAHDADSIASTSEPDVEAVEDIVASNTVSTDMEAEQISSVNLLDYVNNIIRSFESHMASVDGGAKARPEIYSLYIRQIIDV
jgi:hypothetical protein